MVQVLPSWSAPRADLQAVLSFSSPHLTSPHPEPKGRAQHRQGSFTPNSPCPWTSSYMAERLNVIQTRKTMFPTHLLELEKQEEVVSGTPLFLVSLVPWGSTRCLGTRGMGRAAFPAKGRGDSRAPRFPSPLSLSWINA